MLACSYRQLTLLKKVTTASQELVNIIVYTTTVGYRLMMIAVELNITKEMLYIKFMKCGPSEVTGRKLLSKGVSE